MSTSTKINRPHVCRSGALWVVKILTIGGTLVYFSEDWPGAMYIANTMAAQYYCAQRYREMKEGVK